MTISRYAGSLDHPTWRVTVGGSRMTPEPYAAWLMSRDGTRDALSNPPRGIHCWRVEKPLRPQPPLSVC